MSGLDTLTHTHTHTHRTTTVTLAAHARRGLMTHYVYILSNQDTNGTEEMSFLVRCPHFNACMVLGVGKVLMQALHCIHK